jgi:hypothetical protein
MDHPDITPVDRRVREEQRYELFIRSQISVCESYKFVHCVDPESDSHFVLDTFQDDKFGALGRRCAGGPEQLFQIDHGYYIPAER